MGLSKLFPCQRRRQEKKKAQQQAEQEKKGPNNNTAPAAPTQQKPAKKIDTDTPPAKDTGTPDLSTSQRVWNRAYDELANDAATSDLVEAYVKILPKATDPDGSVTAGDGLPAEMSDPVRRQAIMKDAIKAGQVKIAKVAKVTNAVGDVVNFVNKFKDVIDLAVSSNPQAALPWAGVCIGLQFLLNPAQASQSQMNGIAYVTTRMSWYCKLTDHLLNQDNLDLGAQSYQAVVDELEERVVALYKALLLYQMKSVCSYYKNQALVFLRNTINLDDWDGQLQAVKDAEAAVQRDSDQYNNTYSKEALGALVQQGREEQKALGDFHQTLQDYIAAQKNMRMDDQDAECLQALYVVDPQGVMETIQGKNDKLLPAAYEWILRTEEYQTFTDWSDPASCRVLWLNGPAGTGKSMLIIGIISALSRQSSKLAPGLAYFFFQALQQNMTSPTDALRSLVWMLLIQQPHLISYIRETLRNTGADYFNNPNVFWPLAKIFKDMLADKNLSPVYLVLDALDECDQTDQPGIRDLRKLISETLDITKVKWLLSSRPEVDIYNRLKNKERPRAVVELDVQSRPEPVNAYIEHKLSQLARENGYAQDVLDEMSEEIRRRAQNTFLWVSLVFKDIIENDLPEYEAIERVKDSPPSLKSLYDRMMAKIESRGGHDWEYCRAVLAASCLATRPLSYDEIHVLAGLPPPVRSELIVQRCGSFLTVKDDVVHVLHNSTREYLHGYFESRGQEGGIGQRHIDLGRRSIDAMSKILKSNIYDLHPGVESKDITLPEKDPLGPVRYSCEFWVRHLCEGGNQSLDDGAEFAFLKEHFLHWLESLSLIQKLPSAISSLRMLFLNAESTRGESPQLIAFLRDAERFVLRNLAAIEQIPLQIYGCALAFSPNRSEIKSRYWNERLSFIGNITGVRENWDPCLQTLAAESDAAGVLFSPDGKVFAVLASDTPKRVQLWDTATGGCTQSLELEEDGFIDMSGAFSPDSKVIAATSGGIVQLWDVSTGACRQRFEISDGSAESLKFSPDGDILAFGNEETVQLWDIDTEACKTILRGHNEEVSSVAYSTDGKILASASSDGTVKVWDSTVGSCQQTFDEGSTPLDVIASPDGKSLAVVNENQGLSLWDIPSGTRTQTLSTDGGIIAAAFSSDGKTIVVGSMSGKVQMLNITTGTSGQTFNHGGFPTAVAISPDNSRIVSASEGGLLRLWDATMTHEGRLNGHDQIISAMEISPDGRTLATGSLDKTVKLWDTTARICRQTLEGHTGYVSCIDFSPDSKTIASGSYDCTARIWDIETGDCKQTLGPFGEDGISVVTFSQDGTVLATGNRNGGVKLWDPFTGACTQTLENDGDHPKSILSLALSRDSSMLLVGTVFDGAQLYDASTGTCRLDMRKSPGQQPVSHVAISPDGKTLAFGTFSDEVEVWDAETGVCQHTIKSEVQGLGLSFSDDGQYLKTTQGSYTLTSGALAPSSDADLYRDPLWVRRGDQRLLYLLPEYRGWSATLGPNAVAFAGASGQVIFLDLI